MSVEERLERIERLLVLSGKEVFNTKEAAMFLGISETRLYHLVSGKQIPHYKKGQTNFFKKTELEGWMTSQKVSTEQEIRAQAETHIVTHQ